MSLHARVLSVEIDGVDQAVTCGNLRQILSVSKNTWITSEFI